MSYRKIFWGVILVMIGILFILKNVGLIYFDWLTMWRLWPLVLILWGVSLIPVKDYIKLILSVVAIALSVFLVNRYDKTGYYDFGWHNRNHRFEREWKGDWSENSDGQELSQAFDSTINRVSLSLEAAAGEFKLSDSVPSDKMITLNKKGNIGNYSMTATNDSSHLQINLNIEDSNVKFNNKGMRVLLGLNKNPVWDFDFDIGAASLKFDLSSYKVGDLSIDGGASSIDIKLGDLNDVTKVTINAGASSIDLSLPESCGAEIRTETVLTSRNFSGFKKVGDGLFRTDNFGTSTHKIMIEIDAGVSSVDISRY